MRLDKYIQEKFNLKSRTYAENLIKTGSVFVDGKVATKAGEYVSESSEVKISDNKNFASQGAYKLEKAFEEWNIDVQGKSCVDIGCSNGGFTDCLLRRGAKCILAIDVGECALEKSLLDSRKVTFLRANARELPPLEQVDFLCSDLSFISLKHVLGSMYSLLKDGGQAVVLVKPQFELDKSALNKNGIVKSEKLRKIALDNVKNYVIDCGFSILGETVSPIRFENKNIEYLLFLKKPQTT